MAFTKKPIPRNRLFAKEFLEVGLQEGRKLRQGHITALNRADLRALRRIEGYKGANYTRYDVDERS